MLSNSNRCNCQIGSGIPIGSNWAIIDAGMTERFRMPMTLKMDGAGAFAGGSVYHSCLGTRGFLGEEIALDAILTTLPTPVHKYT